MKGAVVAGKRKTHGVRKSQSHRCDHKHFVSSSRDANVKRASMPCMGTTYSDTSENEQSPAQLSGVHRKPATRDSDKFYSMAVNETEEWAQVIIILHFLATLCCFIFSETGKTTGTYKAAALTLICICTVAMLSSIAFLVVGYYD